MRRVKSYWLFLLVMEILGTLFPLNSQVVVGDFWNKLIFPLKGLSPRGMWLHNDEELQMILSGHDTFFETQTEILLLPLDSLLHQRKGSCQPNAILRKQFLVLDANSSAFGKFLLGYDETKFQPLLFRYTRTGLQELFLHWHKPELLFLKTVAAISRDTLLAAGYLEDEQGELKNRQSVLVWIYLREGTVDIQTMGIADIEDGFVLLRVQKNHGYVVGTVGRGDNLYYRILDINLFERKIRWEKKFSKVSIHQLIPLSNQRMVIIGTQQKAVGQKEEPFLTIIDARGHQLWQWKPPMSTNAVFKDGVLTLDGYLGVCGFQRQGTKKIPTLWKFDLDNRTVMFSRTWPEMNGLFTQILDLPRGFLIAVGYGRQLQHKVGILAVEKEIDPQAFPANLKIYSKIDDSDGDGFISPGESFTLALNINNQGKTAAFYPTLHLKYSSNDFTFLAGNIKKLPIIYPGQTYALRISGVATPNLAPGKHKIQLYLSSSSHFGSKNFSSSKGPVVTLQFITPLQSTEQWISVNAVPETLPVEDTVIVRFILQNISNHPISPGAISCISMNPHVFIGKQTYPYEKTLDPGEMLSITVPIYGKAPLAYHENVPITLVFTLQKESTTFNVTVPLTFKEKLKAQKASVTSATAFRLNTSIDIEANIPQYSQPDPNRFAVIIGNKDYREPIPEVTYALRDAFVIKEYLIRALGFPEGNVFFLPNATKSEMERFFGDEHDFAGKLYNMLNPGQSEVIVFYAGHGAPGRVKGEGNYLVPVDADPAYLKLTGYSLNTFFRNLSKLPAKSVILIIDACFSGQVYSGISPVYVYVPPEKRFPPHFAVLSSTTETQPSCWLPAQQHSLFTYMFLKGIQTFQADLNNDGSITVGEMVQYLNDTQDLSHSVPYQARRLQNVEQHPHLMSSNPELKLVVQKDD